MKLYYGTYGHHLSGKLYVYWGDDNLRSGQQVVAPVTGKNGKEYNTMFTIARAFKGETAAEDYAKLTERGIFIKTISGRDTLSLPGAEKGGFETKKAWKEESDARYDNWRRKQLGLPSKEEEERQNRIAQETPREPSPHAVNPQYVKRVKEEQSQLTKALKRFNKDNAADTQAANERAKTALRQRQTVNNTVKQRQRLINMRRH